jgi:cytoskeletal protein CcmA (bactofilin family)
MGVFSKSNTNHSKTTTLISQGAFFKGDVLVSGNLHIDGAIEGNIKSESNISIGKEGKVKGDIKAKRLIITGKFEGKAECDEVEILKGGILNGEIFVKNLVIEKGGEFNGVCHKDKKINNSKK